GLVARRGNRREQLLAELSLLVRDLAAGGAARETQLGAGRDELLLVGQPSDDVVEQRRVHAELRANLLSRRAGIERTLCVMRLDELEQARAKVVDDGGRIPAIANLQQTNRVARQRADLGWTHANACREHRLRNAVRP